MKRILLVILTFMLPVIIAGCARKTVKDVKNSFNNSGNASEEAEVSVPAEIPEGSLNTDKEEDAVPTVSPVKVSANKDPGLYPAYKVINGVNRYGYINDKGEFVIEPSFDSAGNFNDGLAVVSTNGTYEVIDKNGNVFFKNSNVIEDFSNGAAAFHKTIGSNELIGYIDTDGNIIIEPQYQSAGDFDSENKAVVSSGNGKYLVIDKNGNTLESHRMNDTFNVRDFIDGYRVYTDYNTWNYGVIDLQGNTVFEPEYSQIYNIGNGLFAIRKQSKGDNSIPVIYPMAIFDKNGKQLTDYIHYEVNEFYGSYASASDSQYTYFIGTDGEPVKDLPRVKGIGSMKLLGDVIQADIDNELFYMKKDGTVIWSPGDTIKLTDGITVKKLKSRPNRFTLIFYPSIEGLKNKEAQQTINKELSKLFQRDEASIKIENATSVNDYFTVKLSKDLLIVNKKGYDNPYGAAHGMPVNDYFYFDIKTGRRYELSDLFKEDSYFISRLNMLIERQIEEAEDNNSGIPIDGFEGISEHQGFILSDNAMTVYFYPYDIAAYAAGFPEFKITYSKIYDIIDKDGAFWNSFNHENVTPVIKSEDTELADIMDSIVKLYDRAMVTAVNSNYFSYMEPYLAEGTSLYNSKKDQVESYYKDNITLKYLDSSVEKIEYNKESKSYLVYVSESISIKQSDTDNELRKLSNIYTICGSKEKHSYLIYDISEMNEQKTGK